MSCASAGSITTSTRRLTTRSSGAKSGTIIITSVSYTHLRAPACTDGKRFYYRSVSFTKPEELEKRLAQALRKKQPLFVFHWRGGGLNRDTLQQLLALAGRLAAERGKRASCSVNFPQAVIQLEFSEAPQESITIQQANEAEAPVNEAN